MFISSNPSIHNSNGGQWVSSFFWLWCWCQYEVWTIALQQHYINHYTFRYDVPNLASSSANDNQCPRILLMGLRRYAIYYCLTCMCWNICTFVVNIWYRQLMVNHMLYILCQIREDKHQICRIRQRVSQWNSILCKHYNVGQETYVHIINVMMSIYCAVGYACSALLDFEIWDFPGQVDIMDKSFDGDSGIFGRGCAAVIFVIDAMVCVVSLHPSHNLQWDYNVRWIF